jgi:hypothetical protein
MLGYADEGLQLCVKSHHEISILLAYDESRGPLKLVDSVYLTTRSTLGSCALSSNWVSDGPASEIASARPAPSAASILGPSGYRENLESEICPHSYEDQKGCGL